MYALTPRMLSLALLLVTDTACRRSPAAPAAPPALALAGEWTLADLGAQPAPPGSAGRRATLQFDADSSRVSGFAGCNRLSGGYTTHGDSLTFGPAAMTRMACADGMELERRLASALTATRRFRVTSSELTLLGAAGPVARFTRSTP